MFESLDLFQVSHAMARHAGQRHALVARNMANADTPGYRPSDLAPFHADIGASGSMKATRPGHIDADASIGGFRQITAESTSMSPNGNAVSVEEEMLRAVDVKRQHDRALAVYRHTLTMLRASIGRQ